MAKDTMVLKNAVENALSDANKNKMLKYLCDPSAGGCCCKKVTIRIFVQNVPETRGSRDWLEANGYGGVEAASKAGIEFTADVDCTSYNSGTPGLANHLVTSKP